MEAASIVLHAGAGESWFGDDELQGRVETFLESLASEAYENLRRGWTSIDVVAHVVSKLEDFPDFNAGKGAAMTDSGSHELEAAIVDGLTGEYRAAARLKHVKNPIRLPQAMLSTSGGPCFIIGDRADKLAKEARLDIVPNDYFTTSARQEFWQAKRRSKLVDEHGTVGAVALDVHGNLAAANSTGGTMFKMEGRLGDTTILGAGLYADDKLAIACSGGGEAILKSMLAHRVVLERDAAPSLEDAVDQAMFKSTGLFPELSCGLIALDSRGNISVRCNSRLFRVASAGRRPGENMAGILRCTLPINQRFCFYEDDVVISGFAKHPAMHNHVIVSVKKPYRERVWQDASDFLRLFRVVRGIAQHLATACAALDCGLTFAGHEIFVYPLLHTPNGPRVARQDNDAMTSLEALHQGSHRAVIVREGAASPSQPQRLHLRLDDTAQSSQEAQSFLRLSQDKFDNVAAMIFSFVQRSVELLSVEKHRVRLILDPFSSSACFASSFLVENGEHPLLFPKVVPLSDAYPGYLPSELGPRMLDWRKTIAMATLLRKEMSC